MRGFWIFNFFFLFFYLFCNVYFPFVKYDNDFLTEEEEFSFLNNSKFIFTDKDNDIEKEENNRLEYRSAEDVDFIKQYRIYKNPEKNREKISKEYLEIYKKKKYCNFLDVLKDIVQQFRKNEKKTNTQNENLDKKKRPYKKLLDRNTIRGLEILKKGGFIDKIGYKFNISELENLIEKLGIEKAREEYSREMSLDKLAFIHKILECDNDQERIEENYKILNVLLKNNDLVMSLYEKLQNMISFQDFLLLFNKNISFLNQCGFPDLEFIDCLSDFNLEENMGWIREYGQYTGFFKKKRTGFEENKYKSNYVYGWNFIDYINPFSWIGYWLRKYKFMHIVLNVLHVKYLLFFIMICFLFKLFIGNGKIESLYSLVSNETLKKVLRPILSILGIIEKGKVTIFKYFALYFIFRFIPFLQRLPFILSSIVFIIYFVFKNFREILIAVIDFFSRQNKNQNRNIEIVQNDDVDDFEEGKERNFLVMLMRNLLSYISKFIRTIKPLLINIFNFVLKYKWLILCSILLLVIVFVIYNIVTGYKRTLKDLLYKSLREKTLGKVRGYINNMKDFYSEIKNNDELFEVLKDKMQNCISIFDVDFCENKNLTKKQKRFFELLNNENDDEQLKELFIILFTEKDMFLKPIIEIADVSTYVNSSKLVMYDGYCVVNFLYEGDNFIKMKKMLHPFLTSNGIKNNFEIGKASTYGFRNMLFTGSNKSGKTTFLVGSGLNVLLGHALGIAFCETCTMTIYDKIIVILEYETDIQNQQSKFSNEVNTLIELLKYLEKNTDLKVLFISDEQLSTTDPWSANNVATKFYRKMYRYENINSLNATHLDEPKNLEKNEPELGVGNFKLTIVVSKDRKKMWLTRKLHRGVGKYIGDLLAEQMGLIDLCK